jgi:hypothetical protein
MARVIPQSSGPRAIAGARLAWLKPEFCRITDGMQRPQVAVFAGPSLPPSDRPALDGLAYFAPAKRGDVENAAREYDAVLLIDGVFHGEFSTTPKEMLRACRLARMFGAASMGALRAAECRPYGAVTLGAIANWYARGIIEGDDEVALLMHPTTFAALTVPSINVRYVAWLARRRGILTTFQSREWAERARTGIFYAERSWSAVLDLAPEAARDALADIARNQGDLKRWDARFALRRMERLLAHRAVIG